MLSAIRLRILSCGMISGSSVSAGNKAVTGAARGSDSGFSLVAGTSASTSCKVIRPSRPVPASSLISRLCSSTRCLTAGLKRSRSEGALLPAALTPGSVTGFSSVSAVASVLRVHSTSPGLTSSSCRILISAIRPVSGAATSTTTLSVSISTMAACAWTLSPSATSQRVTVASVPSCWSSGKRTSMRSAISEL